MSDLLIWSLEHPVLALVYAFGLSGFAGIVVGAFIGSSHDDDQWAHAASASDAERDAWRAWMADPSTSPPPGWKAPEEVPRGL